MNRKGWKYLLGWGIPAVLLLVGVIGAGVLVIGGEQAFGTSDAVPWGLLIAGYVWLAVTASGLCLASSLGHVFNVEVFQVMVPRAIFLAITVLVAGFSVLAVELGHPFRLVYILLTPNFSSGIWWMGTIYGIYLVFLVIELFFLLTHRHRAARVTGVITFMLAVAATSNLGAVFGFVNARPFWAGPYYSLFILLTAVLSGFAALGVLTWLLQRGDGGERGRRMRHLLPVLGSGMAALLGAAAVFTVWKIISGLYGGQPGTYQAVLTLVDGPLSLNFWLLEVTIGLAVPLVWLLLAAGRRQVAVFVVSTMVLVGLVFTRLDMVAAGQIVPLANLDAACPFTGCVNYSPSFGEWTVIAGALGFILLVYRAGERMLDLDE
ncbi:hypothetical protein SY88_18395 [Clostridiales bacterium PH28_bin88]|nr:hypothetical protein SY88_18395 [Clostridiales bacterium PH28_bin88]